MPIVINSQYKPFTYDELTKPLIEQTQAQQALENAYMEAQDQAAQIMSLADEQTDHDSYIKLKNYANAIQQQADSLMRQGLSGSSRQSLINMRRRYGQEILPIQNAVARRQMLDEERRKAGPDYLWEKDMLSLDELVRNPNADYGSYYNGQMITKRVADAVKAVGDSMVSMETSGHLTPYQIKVLEKHGFTADEIASAIAGGKDAKSLMLASVRDRVLNSIDVYNKGNAATKARALDYANEGLYAGLGSSKYSLVTDEQAKADLEVATYKRKQTSDQEAAQEAALRAQLSSIVPTNIYSEEERDNINQASKMWSKYFKVSPDGTYTLNEAGRREYERRITEDHRVGVFPDKNTPFRNFMNSIISDTVDAVSGENSSEAPNRKLNLTNEQLGQAFKDYINAPENYDATKLTEYNYNIAGQDLDDWDRIITNASNNKAYTAVWDKENKTYRRGKEVDMSDALANGHISSVQYSPYGITMKITGKGKTQRYMLPAGINAPIEENLKSTMAGLKRVQELYKQMGANYIIPLPQDIHNALRSAGVPEEELPRVITKDHLQLLAASLEANGQFYISQLMNTNKTTPQTWNLIAQ